MIVFGVLFLQLLRPTLVTSQALPGCPNSCGNVSIPYPFGIGENCYRDVGFSIGCNKTEEGWIPYITGGNVNITDITLLKGKMKVAQFVALDCYKENGNQSTYNSPYMRLGKGKPFTFSDTENKFTVLGCDTYAYLENDDFRIGCDVVCSNSSLVTNGSCSGIGCCQTSIPKRVKYIEIQINSFDNHTKVHDFNPCGYAFLADQEWFNFSGLSDLSSEFFGKNNQIAPLALDWVIGNQACKEAKKNASDYACRQNSNCYNSNNVPGYLCNCKPGYLGNPYLDEEHGGCSDIDECKDNHSYPCKGICINTPGSYKCECPKGKKSNNPNMYECKASFPVVPVALGIGIPFLLVLIVSWIYLGLQTRRLNDLKEKFFQQNGGLHLHQLLSSNPNIAFKMFSKEELEKATNKFNHNNILGQGGQGMVFKGVLPNNQMVAVKKSMVVNEMQNAQFANEMIILSQINHKNVVKLLGCCLEVEVPMLVYEFISNGTLFNFIHGGRQLCFKDLLKFATEIASAIAYLHSAASPPILHGDIKSSNILLDENHMAKVSDFGASKLTPIDKDQFATFMQGTWGYLDPECLQTGQLTDKSDVYSFGVVLAELLTRRKAVSFIEGNVNDRNLANIFVTSMKESRIMDLLDPHIVKAGRMDLITEVCKLTARCLSIIGECRPTMKEVAMELEGLAMFEIHPWVPNNPEEMESLLGQSSDNCAADSTGFYSLEKRVVFSIDAGR